MRMAIVGLGKMGSGMRERLRRGGHEVVGFDNSVDSSDAGTLAEAVDMLGAGPKAVWVMVPAGRATHAVIVELAALLGPGDLVVDGGNSRFTDDRTHSSLLAERGIGYLDCGVSGGIRGQHEGYALMVGGESAHVERLMPIFDSLRPPGVRENSFVHAGPVGSGHYAKMVHNGIEYGLMHAYAEGFELLTAEDSIADPAAVMKAWTCGTVVRSWLLDLLVSALAASPDLAEVSGYTEDSGEGRWTVEEAIAHAVPVPVISAALFARFSSRQDESPAMKAVAALRQQFGGHTVQLVVPTSK